MENKLWIEKRDIVTSNFSRNRIYTVCHSSVKVMLFIVLIHRQNTSASDFPSKKAAKREEREGRKSDVSRVFVRVILIVLLTAAL